MTTTIPQPTTVVASAKKEQPELKAIHGTYMDIGFNLQTGSKILHNATDDNGHVATLPTQTIGFYVTTIDGQAMVNNANEANDKRKEDKRKSAEDMEKSNAKLLAKDKTVVFVSHLVDVLPKKYDNDGYHTRFVYLTCPKLGVLGMFLLCVNGLDEVQKRLTNEFQRTLAKSTGNETKTQAQQRADAAQKELEAERKKAAQQAIEFEKLKAQMAAMQKATG